MGLRELVIRVMPAPSSNEVARRVPRQRRQVLATLRQLADEGTITRDVGGWRLTSTAQVAGIAQEGADVNVAFCDHPRVGGVSVSNHAGSR